MDHRRWKIPNDLVEITQTVLVGREFFVTEKVVTTAARPCQNYTFSILLDLGRLGKATRQGCEAAIALFSGGPRESCPVLEWRRSCPRSPESDTQPG